MMLVKIKDCWINPEAITHLTPTAIGVRVHLLSGTYTDILDITSDEVVKAIVDAYKIKLGVPEWTLP